MRGDGKDLRRSSRIVLSIPVEFHGWDTGGQEVHEKTITDLVNKHGCRISLHHKISVGSNCVLRIPRLNREQQCRVAWLSGMPEERNNYQVAVELDSAENFWGVNFPPGDWGVSDPASLVGDLPDTSHSQKELNEHELQRLSSVVNAVISLLAKKGVLTRSELDELLQQIN